MQGLIFVFICILIFKFYIVHNIASHDAIFFRQTGASRGWEHDVTSREFRRLEKVLYDSTDSGLNWIILAYFFV